MLLTAVVVSTEQVSHVLSNYVNGVSIVEALFGSVKLNKGVAILNDQNVQLKPLKGGCSKGLSQGVGRYVLGLANAIAK